MLSRQNLCRLRFHISQPTFLNHNLQLPLLLQPWSLHLAEHQHHAKIWLPNRDGAEIPKHISLRPLNHIWNQVFKIYNSIRLSRLLVSFMFWSFKSITQLSSTRALYRVAVHLIPRRLKDRNPLLFSILFNSFQHHLLSSSFSFPSSPNSCPLPQSLSKSAAHPAPAPESFLCRPPSY